MAKKTKLKTNPKAEIAVIEKRPVGRPSEYRPEIAQELLDYFGKDPYVEKEQDILTKTGDVITIKKDVASDFPTLAGFAIKLGICRDTLLEWSKEYPEFSGAYKRAKDFQENFLAVNGNKGLIHPAFAIFTAKNVLNWRDKKDVEHSGFIAEITDEELDRKIAEKKKLFEAGE